MAYNTHNFLKLPSYDMNSHINKQLMEILWIEIGVKIALNKQKQELLTVLSTLSTGVCNNINPHKYQCN